tara:strand:+ start:3771 stop:4058 length:288 start_codon:yes stop_codon:yes gene_type:complete
MLMRDHHFNLTPEELMTTNTNTLDVYSIGTTVALLESLDAKIVTIAIHEDNFVTYECSWWSGESRTKDWFSASDFISIGEKAAVTKIGFIRHSDE